DQGRDGRHQHALHRVPGDPVRRLQAIRLRPRALDRHARALPRDEGRPRLHEPEAVQPVPPLALAAPEAYSRPPPTKRRDSMATSTVAGLEGAVRGRVVTSGDADYDESRSLFNAMIDKRPAAIAYCVDE